MTQAGFFPPSLVLGGTLSSTSHLVKGFCKIFHSDLFSFLLRRIQFLIFHCALFYFTLKNLMGKKKKKKSEIPSKGLVVAADLWRFIYSRSSLNLVLRVSGNLKKPKTQQDFLLLTTSHPTPPLLSTYSVCTSIHFSPPSHNLNISVMDT